MPRSEWDRLPEDLRHDIMVGACIFRRGTRAPWGYDDFDEDDLWHREDFDGQGVDYRYVGRVTTSFVRLLEVFGNMRWRGTYGYGVRWSLTFTDGRRVQVESLTSFDNFKPMDEQEWNVVGTLRDGREVLMQRITYLISK